MLSDEEKEEALSETEIRFRADLLILNSEFPTHRKTEAMEELLEIYNKQSKEIEELRNEVMEKELMIDGMKEDRRIAVEEIQEQYYVSKDKIKAKIEELDYNDIGNFERRCKQEVLQSLLEKE